MKKNPTIPGKYIIHILDGSIGGGVEHVIVKKRGKGLSVYVPRFNENIPMRSLNEKGIDSWEIEK